MKPGALRITAIALVGAASFAAVGADTVRLVKDITTTGIPESSFPRDFVDMGGYALFIANTQQTGSELWRTDGTTLGTALVRDITPGPLSTFATNFQVRTTLFRLGEFAYFSGASGRLWRSDGTTAGTTEVAGHVGAPRGGTSGTAIDRLNVYASLHDRLLFSGSTTETGSELWTSDGTSAGTVLVADLNPGAASASPNRMLRLGEQIYFNATDNLGEELWITDGTSQGTRRVKDIRPGGSSSAPRYPCELNGSLLFAADDGVNGSELWISDGTDAGTRMLKDIRAGGSSTPRELTRVGGYVYFTATDGSAGIELWRTDGTEGGTQRVTSLSSSSLAWLTPLGDRLCFVAFRADVGATVWSTDGSAAGTIPAFDNHGVNGVSPLELRSTGPWVYFGKPDAAGQNNVELWRTDGTPSGTSQLEVLPGPAGALTYFPIIEPALGGVLFCAEDGVHGFELWKVDGPAGSATFVADMATDAASSNPKELGAVGDRLFFLAQTQATGMELYVSDGTAAGTQLVRDARPGPDPVGFQGVDTRFDTGITALGSLAIYVFDDGTGADLWRSDGTAAGTARIVDLTMNTQPGYTGRIRSGDRVYFATTTPTYGQELWSTDGSAAGTQLVRDIVAGTGGSNPSMMVDVGGLLVFGAGTAAAGFEPWSTDGTATGTHLLADIRLGPSSSLSAAPLLGYYRAIDGRLWLSANDGTVGEELWIVDPVSQHADRVADINPGPGSSQPGVFCPLRGFVYFSASDGVIGRELWRSDGTETGTELVRDIEPGPASASPAALTALDDAVVFTAFTAEFGRELWISNAITGATFQLKDIAPGAASPTIRSVTRVCDTLYFVADDGAAGEELWRTDGSPAGTTLAADIFPGPGSSSPRELTVIGRRLYFTAIAPVIGRELWAVEVFLPGDVTQDGLVSMDDLDAALASYGCAPPATCIGDADGDGDTDQDDLDLILYHFGRTCPE